MQQHSKASMNHPNNDASTPLLPSEAGAMTSNKEGEMPSWPIPSHWTNASTISDEGVVLYGFKVSPPCCKVRAILKHYGVKFTEVVTMKKETGDYKKTPVLTIGEKQINDSFIIIQVLAQVLENAPMSEREKAIEEMTTTGLMLALEVSVMESTTAMQQCAPHMSDNICLQGMIFMFACCVPCCGLSSRIKSKFPELKSLSAYGHLYAKELGSNPFFHGEQFGVIDCARFGCLEPFAAAGNQGFNDFINTDERYGIHFSICLLLILSPSHSVISPSSIRLLTCF